MEGIVLVVLALVCDAFLGNFQERLLLTFKASRSEMVIILWQWKTFKMKWSEVKWNEVRERERTKKTYECVITVLFNEFKIHNILFYFYLLSSIVKVAFTYSIGFCLLLIWLLVLKIDELRYGIVYLWANFNILIFIMVFYYVTVYYVSLSVYSSVSSLSWLHCLVYWLIVCWVRFAFLCMCV
jgi:hypothetical protein